MSWIDEYADLQGNGYISYKRRNEKDRPREPVLEGLLGLDLVPRRAAARVPARHLRAAGLRLRRQDARRQAGETGVEDPAFADRLEKEAADLKRRFNRDFWVQDGQYFVLALEADGTQVDALASNNGHLLWSGIVDQSKAKAVVRHLMSPAMYSGWGVRTLAEGQGRFNPIGYHVGTIWPFDNSFIAWGLRRYGFRRRRLGSRPASSTRPGSSPAAYRRRSAATHAR